jgi:uncharacterized membrane protein
MAALSFSKPMALPPRESPVHERIFELDFVRGVLMVLLVLYHLAYSLGSPYDFFRAPSPEPDWVINASGFFYDLWYSEPLNFLQHLFSSFFLLLCGVSCGFSRNNLKRGLALYALATAETVFLGLMSFYLKNSGFEVYVYFGILHALGLAILLFGLVDLISKNVWLDVILGFVCLGLMIVYWPDRLVVYNEPATAFLPRNFFQMVMGYAIGGSDTWGLPQAATFVFFGGVLGKTLYAEKRSYWNPKHKRWAAPITWMGRHSLLVYCAEQFIVLAIMWCVLAPFGYTF